MYVCMYARLRHAAVERADTDGPDNTGRSEQPDQ